MLDIYLEPDADYDYELRKEYHHFCENHPDDEISFERFLVIRDKEEMAYWDSFDSHDLERYA